MPTKLLMNRDNQALNLVNHSPSAASTEIIVSSIGADVNANVNAKVNNLFIIVYR
jgi:hypothetical protein